MLRLEAGSLRFQQFNHLKVKLKAEGVTQWYSNCIACVRHWVPPPALKKKRKIMYKSQLTCRL